MNDCDWKQAFTTKQDATAATLRSGHSKQAGIRPYKCRTCNQWHIGGWGSRGWGSLQKKVKA